MIQKKNKKIKFKSLYLMLLPAMILYLIFVLYPLFYGAQISFRNWNGYSQHYTYAGFENFLSIFKDKRVPRAFTNTLIYGIGGATIQNILGLAYALLLNNKTKIRNLVKVTVYMPSIVSGLIMGFIWYFMFQYDLGALNDFMMMFGFQRMDWMADGTRGVYIIMLVSSFQFVGSSMIIYLAGLQMIPEEYLEAAYMEGAGAWLKFRYVTLPLLGPSITTSFTLKIIGGFQIFDTIIAMTNGGPGFSTHSVSTLINYMYFQNQNAGYASALGLVLFLFIISVSLTMNRFFSRREVDYW